MGTWDIRSGFEAIEKDPIVSRLPAQSPAPPPRTGNAQPRGDSSGHPQRDSGDLGATLLVWD